MTKKNQHPILAAGRPVEPSPENKGPHVLALMDAGDRIEKEGREFTPMEAVVALAHFLDVMEWEKDCKIYDKIKAMADLESKRIVVPRGGN